MVEFLFFYCRIFTSYASRFLPLLLCAQEIYLAASIFKQFFNSVMAMAKFCHKNREKEESDKQTIHNTYTIIRQYRGTDSMALALIAN